MKAAKRFWKAVSVEDAGGGFAVHLDGRPVRTPAGAPLCVPSGNLAAAIGDEWDCQKEDIDPSTMPMFGFAVTAIDRITPQRRTVVDEISNYGGSDLVCYRESGNDALAGRQHEVWQPFVDWFAEEEGIRLEVTSGVMPMRQKDAACSVMRARVDGYDDYSLAGLHTLVTVSGSLVLGLAMATGRISADEGGRAAMLDDLWQQEKWGYDAEADARIKTHLGLLADAGRYLSLLDRK